MNVQLLPTTQQFIKIRVLNASTGVSYPIHLHPNEFTVANIRRHLAAYIPVQDQILLLGPPYKVPKDSTLRSEETLSALRLGDLEDDSNYFDKNEENENSSSDGFLVDGGNSTTTRIQQQQDEEVQTKQKDHETTNADINTEKGLKSKEGDTEISSTNNNTTTANTPTTISQDNTSTQSAINNYQTTAKRKTNRRIKCILSTTEKTGARRLFLFSKQALSESAPDPKPSFLQPMDLILPTEADPSPINYHNIHAASSENTISTSFTTTSSTMNTTTTTLSPLHQALQVYERQFALHFTKGRALADGADLRLTSCRSCVTEQAVMARALRAAVSNLSDHRNAAARTRLEFTSLFQTKTAIHSLLLKNFEGHLTELAKEPLHPALVTVARANGRIMETLLDTVPVERERAWYNQCQHSLKRLLTLFEELDNSFALLGTPASRDEEGRQDSEAEEAIKGLSLKVEGFMMDTRDKQAERFARLTMDHKEVVSVVLNAISDDAKAQAAFPTLENMTKASKDILPSMEADDLKLKELMGFISDSKTTAMKRMKMRLRQVSVAQSTIQKVLSSVTIQREALNQLCESMIHLEHVQEFSTSYRDFLSEIRRRRAYGNAVTSSTTVMIERLASMRNDEVKAREKFLRGPGRHLMPPFFEMFVPTLTTPPPLFTPQLPALVEMDTLPDFGPSEITEEQQSPMDNIAGNGASENNDNMPNDARGASDASSLTESLSNQHIDKSDVTAESCKESSNDQEGTTGGKNAQSNDESLIVTANEASSGNDMIMGAGSHNQSESNAEMDAKEKTLAYENAVLRQALERLGGKTPRAYLEEAEKERISSEQKLQSELDKVRKELEETKAELEKANKALEEIKKDDESGDLCGKISHSNIKVGDIALFIPIERTSRGKPDYLAFHTNSPQKYLSPHCIEGKPTYVLGKVIFEEERIAGAKGTDENPHGLPVGKTFWELDVEVLKTS